MFATSWDSNVSDRTLVLGWLGLLPKVIDSFPAIVLASGALQELFEGQRRIREFQKSRVCRAEAIQRAIGRGQAKILRSASATQDTLTAEVGAEMASFIRAAKDVGGVVLRPAPLHKPGLDQIPADVQEHQAVLADMHSILHVLVDSGVIDEKLEKAANDYFVVQDEGWPSSAKPDPTKPLFIDSLALAYLQNTDLLQIVLSLFKDVTIEARTEEEASVLLDYNSHVTEVLLVIRNIRIAVRDAFGTGKITFGPLRQEEGDAADGDDGSTLSTVNLLSDLRGADFAVFDDRALNKEGFAQDRQAHRSRCITSLDVIEELHARNVLTEAERRQLRHRLRLAGAALVPVDAAEISAAAQRSGASESAEYHAIRESIDLARIAEIPHFPNEIPWFTSLNTAPRKALIEIWATEVDKKRAAALSNLTYDLKPNPEEWEQSWHGNIPDGWSQAVLRAMLAHLAMPVEIEDDAARNRFNQWLERSVLSELRRNQPELYKGVVVYLRDFIEKMSEEDGDAPE
jgi:hypothetical protein